MEISISYATLVLTVLWITHGGDAVSVFQFFEDIPDGLLNFFMLDCEQSSLNEARNVFNELRDHLPGRRVDIVTVPLDLDKRELKPLIYTKTIDQMAETLENYACSSNLQEDPPSTYDTTDSVILSLIPQLHPKDGIILFGSILNSTTPSMSSSIHRQLKPKGNQIHILHRENTHISGEYQDLIRLTWGQVITYGNNDRVSLSQLDDFNNNYNNYNNNETHFIQAFAQPNYKTSVTKHRLQQDTRTEIILPQGTFRVFINIHGILRKALLLSPTGISINLLPIDNASRLLRNRTVNFDMTVLKSPSSWTLSCNGEQYNVTVMKLRNFEDRLLTDKSISPDQSHVSVALKQRSINPEHSMTKRLDLLRPQFYADGQFDMDLGAWYANSNDFPTTIDVDLQSTFFLMPGEMARILLQVRNNKPIQTRYHFDCVYPQQPCVTRPRTVVLMPGQSIPVDLIVRAEGIDDSSNIITFICKDIEIVHRKIYLFIGRQRSDTTRPDIGFEYNGNCDDANTGNTCTRKRWSVELYARDTGSGLLSFWSEPSGLYYTSEFTVGTRDPVPGRYSASCCETKVDILAMDLKGNVNKVVLDVEHQYLNWVEISAIVLAAILLILIIALLIFLLVRWRRKRKEMSFLNN
ncbi:uncharacterized protein LOC135848535 [Planococcus citri]|uniref:uncharacterized protein LOC135848535 n=1 Tax=Planococcus citri TaxID=170843 RepID=UPI0031F770E7